MAGVAPAAGSDVWIRPQAATDPLVWGRRDGIVFGLPSPGGIRGPRGLIRVGVPGRDGAAELVNFIAVEPVVKGEGSRQNRMAFSELEMSELDKGQRGKRLWVAEGTGELVARSGGSTSVECLRVPIEVEKFTANRTHVYIVASLCADRPRELELAVHHHEDSAPIEELTLTATMGNYERVRHLWLRGRVIDSRELYAGYEGEGFIDKENYPRDALLKLPNGDVLALATTNEDDPASVEVSQRPWWTYKSIKLTQYWRVPATHVQSDLRLKVNGRRVYWASKVPIPGGVAFENFEMRQRYVPGQTFVFGLTPSEPWDFEPPIPALPARPTPPGSRTR